MRAVVLLALGLAACSSVDRQNMTTFEPMAGGQFAYSSVAGVEYPVDSPPAEATRRQWLEQYLRDNNLCGAGYEITERKVVTTVRTLVGTGYRIYYRGRCRS